MKNTKKSATVRKLKIKLQEPKNFLEKYGYIILNTLAILCLGFILIGLIAKYTPDANAFFWRNPQQVYDQAIKQRQIATQNFIESSLGAIDAQKDLAYHKLEIATQNENIEEIERLTNVIKKLDEKKREIKQHTKIVFIQAQR